jgi:hypothetical protein
MKYVDYDWEINEHRIVIDQEINIDKLGWKNGDHFELKNINGQVQLVKIDPLVKFIKGYK